jgi:hypothetical protein
VTDLMGNEFGNDEAIVYRAWRDAARALLAVTLKLQPAQLRLQEAQQAFDTEPKTETSERLLMRALEVSPLRQEWAMHQQMFQTALQALTNVAAPPPVPE